MPGRVCRSIWSSRPTARQAGRSRRTPRGPELARARAEEAACAATTLGVKPPILLGFPDAQLGNYAEDHRVYRLTQRIQEELQRLHPDALITWGPDGGTGHDLERTIRSRTAFVRIAFIAKVTGVFEIELHLTETRGLRIGLLTVK